MLGNTDGPLKASPNSIVPIPIDNQHFKGLQEQDLIHICIIASFDCPWRELRRPAFFFKAPPKKHTRAGTIDQNDG